MTSNPKVASVQLQIPHRWKNRDLPTRRGFGCPADVIVVKLAERGG
jgi:hypothetical protein